MGASLEARGRANARYVTRRGLSPGALVDVMQVEAGPGVRPGDRATANPAGLYNGGVRHLRVPAVVVAALSSAVGVATAEPEQEPAPVPVGRRLSPRNDAVIASVSATHNGELDTRDLRLKAAAPLVRGDGYGIAMLVGYGATHLDLSTAEGEQHLALHRFDATVAGGAGLAPGWSLRGSLGAAHSSDLQDATWRAVQVTSAAMVHRVLGPSDGLLVGLVYSSAAELFPVLPIVGYVHQREGSPYRFDVFLPRHARAEYELRPWLRGALGVEVIGNNWLVHRADAEVRARRAGGSVFGELQLAATQLLRVEARLGLSVDQYTLPASPAAMGNADMTIDRPLRAAGFAQLAVMIAQ